MLTKMLTKPWSARAMTSCLKHERPQRRQHALVERVGHESVHAVIEHDTPPFDLIAKHEAERVREVAPVAAESCAVEQVGEGQAVALARGAASDAGLPIGRAYKPSPASS